MFKSMSISSFHSLSILFIKFKQYQYLNPFYELIEPIIIISTIYSIFEIIDQTKNKMFEHIDVS